MDNHSREQQQTRKKEATIAPGMEMDALDEEATAEEIKKHDYTTVSQLYVDRAE